MEERREKNDRTNAKEFWEMAMEIRWKHIRNLCISGETGWSSFEEREMRA